MFSKLNVSTEVAENSPTELRRRIQAAVCVSEKTYELRTRISNLCYHFFGSFPVTAAEVRPEKSGEGYLYEIDRHLEYVDDQLREMEQLIQKLETL